MPPLPTTNNATEKSHKDPRTKVSGTDPLELKNLKKNKQAPNDAELDKNIPFHPTSIADVIYGGVGFCAGVLFVILLVLAHSAKRANIEKKSEKVMSSRYEHSSVPDMYGSSLETTSLEMSNIGWVGNRNSDMSSYRKTCELPGTKRQTKATSFYDTSGQTYAAVSLVSKSSAPELTMYGTVGNVAEPVSALLMDTESLDLEHSSSNEAINMIRKCESMLMKVSDV